MHRVGIAVAAAVVLLSAACEDGSPLKRGPYAPLNPTSPGTPAPTAELKQLSASASCSVGAVDLEGKFAAPEQMDDYLECILPAVEKWIDTTYQDMPSPSAYNFVPAGASGQEPNGGCDYDEKALKYCFDSRVVYFGQAAVWDQYTRFGDAAPALIAAHEVTHHFQEVLEMPEPTLPNEVIRFENQADCGAGAFMAYARAQGWMNMDDDIVDLAGALEAAGQSEGPSRTHGTIEERLQAFDTAYLSQGAQPIAECSSFVPEVPILN